MWMNTVKMQLLDNLKLNPMGIHAHIEILAPAHMLIIEL